MLIRVIWVRLVVARDGEAPKAEKVRLVVVKDGEAPKAEKARLVVAKDGEANGPAEGVPGVCGV